MPRVQDPNKQCAATSKTTGKRCTQPVAPGHRVCRYHGGKTPSGVASPHFKHGERTKVMGPSLAEAYQAVMNDPELLSSRRNAALAEVRILMLLEQVQSNLSIKRVQDAHAALQTYQRYRHSTKKEE